MVSHNSLRGVFTIHHHGVGCMSLSMTDPPTVCNATTDHYSEGHKTTERLGRKLLNGETMNLWGVIPLRNIGWTNPTTQPPNAEKLHDIGTKAFAFQTVRQCVRQISDGQGESTPSREIPKSSGVKIPR